MKTTIWISAVSIILIAIVVGSIFYFESLREPSQPDPLVVDNLSALADGQVSFNVTLNDYESGIIERVVVNGERYSWSHGSQENSTILNDQTKQWRIDIGTLEEDDEMCTPVKSPGIYYIDYPMISIIYFYAKDVMTENDFMVMVCFISPLGVGLGTQVGYTPDPFWRDNSAMELQLGTIFMTKMSDNYLPE